MAHPIHDGQHNEQRRWKTQPPLRRPIAPHVLLGTFPPRRANRGNCQLRAHTTIIAGAPGAPESHHSRVTAPDTQSHICSDLAAPPSPPEVTQVEFNPFLALPEDLDFDTMPYPYPRYTDGPDAESHIRSFVSTWQANHST